MHGDQPPDDVERLDVDDDEGPGGLVAELGRLLELALLAVPTCIGVSLVLRAHAPTVRWSHLHPGRHHEPVRASLAVRLPRPPTSPSAEGGELVLYAGAPDAFADTAPWLLALLDMSSRQVTVDAHLELPDLAEEQAARARWQNDQTVMDQAIGILLETGLLPDEAHLELARRAAAGGTSTLDAARALISSIPNGPDQA